MLHALATESYFVINRIFINCDGIESFADTINEIHKNWKRHFIKNTLYKCALMCS